MLAKKITLRDNETITLVLQQHYLRVLGNYFFAGCLLLVAAFFSSWLLHHDWWGMLLLILGLVLGLFVLVRTWFLHQSNVLVITTERVVRIHRRGFFDELVTSFYFNDIYNTTVRRQGIWGRFFKYGTLVLRGKEDAAALEMAYLPDPKSIEELIFDERENGRKKTERSDRDAVYGRFILLAPEFSKSELQAAKEAIERQLDRLEGVGLR